MTEINEIPYNIWIFMSILANHEALVDDCLEIYSILYEDHCEAIRWTIDEGWIFVEGFNDYSQKMYVRLTLQGLWQVHLARRSNFLEHLWEIN